jgi:hypothetical protein
MKLRGTIKDLQDHEYLELFERYTKLSGVVFRGVEILADEEVFVFIEQEKKEVIEITDFNSIKKVVDKCLKCGWI